MVEPSLVPLGVEVPATTFASKLAPPAAPPPSAGRAPLIQYTPEVLESIRSVCAMSFVSDGAGVPIMGLLYGTRTPDSLAITAWVPAGELRSHNDAEFALKMQMRLAPGRPETAGLTCLGWVRTRNHGEPRLVQEDQDLHERCFPDFGQTVMVVRPSFQRPTKTAFYQRGPNGRFRPDRPAQEFFLYPAQEAELEQPLPVVEAAPAELAALEPAAPVAPVPARRPAAATAEELELLPRGTVRAFSPWIASFLIAVGLLAGAGIAAVRQDRESRLNAPVFEPMRLSHENGQWLVRWSPSLADLEGTAGASLSILRNGQQPDQVTLTVDALRSGLARLDQVSDEMEITLRLNRPGYPETEQRVRLIGPSSTPVP